MARISYRELVVRVTNRLVRAGCLQANAASVAQSIARAEAEGNDICGLYYLPIFEEQVRAGRIRGAAEPLIVNETSSALVVDAALGFAQPAIDLGSERAIQMAQGTGIAAFSVIRSYNALSLGGITGPIAERGLFAMAFANAPASVAPPGSHAKVFGTNPFSVSAPLPGGSALTIDQSTSAVAKTKIMQAAETGDSIPLGWAQSEAGEPTQDANAALSGSILPNGGWKGGNVALLVELLAAALTGGTLSADAAMLGEPDAPHPMLGQFIIVIDPDHFGGAAAQSRLTALVDIFKAEDLHIPGERRRENLARVVSDGFETTPEIAAL